MNKINDLDLNRNIDIYIAGMNSKDFALVLFDALARKRNLTGDVIRKEDLEDFWKQISDQRFDSRLMTFFDV